MKPNLIIDTNILLTDARNILMLGKDYTIVLPETVLDEIDIKKTSANPEIRYQVRELGRILTSGTKGETTEVGMGAISLTLTPVHLANDVEVWIASRSEYPVWSNLEASVINDRRIIQIALDYQTLGWNTTFMTNDIMANYRATAFGLNVIDLKIVIDKPLEFTRKITVDSDVFSALHNTLILSINPDHEPMNYNYMFIDAVSEQVKLANIRNGLIDILGKDTETDLRRQDATPRNAGQLFLSRAIQNPHVDIVVCEASAGTGKTISAFSNAIQLVKRKEYGGIMYIRNSVEDLEKEEQMGFRSGNEEKTAPFFRPVFDTLDFIVRNRHKDSKLKGRELEEYIQQQIEGLIDRCSITYDTTLGLRGGTITNKVVIIDEAQNMTKSAMQKVITRIGDNCKLIVIGSNKQIDHPNITKFTNGLSILLDACTKPQETIRLHAVQLTKILRSDIAEFAEGIFSK
jgi:PhoH-like ATPase